MTVSAVALAVELLEGGAGGLEELRVHEFVDDDEAHDDAAIEELYRDFGLEFDRVVTALSEKYGEPVRIGEQDDDLIPLNGVFRFAVWSVGDEQLFAAAAHEDRGAPILMMLGTGD